MRLSVVRPFLIGDIRSVQSLSLVQCCRLLIDAQARTLALILSICKLLHMAYCIAHDSASGHHVLSAAGRPSVLWIRMPSGTGRSPVLGSCGAKSNLLNWIWCPWHNSQTRTCSHHLVLPFPVKLGRPIHVTTRWLNLRSLPAHRYTIPMLSVSTPCRTN